MARQVLENGVILPAEYSDDWYDDMTSNLTKLDDVIGSDSEKLSSADVGAAALSNSYNDLDNLPTIPTKTSDLTNDSNFVDTSNSAVASGITSAKVTDYDSHIADTDIHVTTADKTKWNNGVSQSYVFRYSSTALVASSTNSNTLLDNTDNLKVGDKVIDSSGVLFSVTAIDTANSTFTIGTALIDLAQDSDVVHKSGDETITGFKQFANIRLNNSIKGVNLEGTTTDLDNCYSDFAPYGENRGGNIQYYYCNTDAGTANISNLPEAKAFFLTSITTRLISNSLYVKQILINSNSKTFVRYCNNSTWSSWVNETDSEYVHKSGDETIGGTKTFGNGTLIVNNGIGSNVHGEIKFVGSRSGYIVADNAADGVFDNANCGVSILLQDAGKPFHVGSYQVDSNGRVFADNTNKKPVLTITGGLVKTATLVPENDTGNSAFRILSQIDYANGNPSKVLDVRFIQYDNVSGSSAVYSNDDGKTLLGATSKRWSGVYSTNYYYGSNNVEFSDKFVTTDTNQTISGNKTFSGNTVIYNSDNTANTPNLTLRSSKSARGTSDTDVQTIFFSDKNGATLASVKAQNFAANGATYLLNTVSTKDTSNQLISASTSLYILNNGRKVFRPEGDNDILLGYTGSRWKDVNTYLVNGLTPSSLSLPSNTGYVDISSYFTNTGDGQTNSYTASANGWIYLNVTAKTLIMQIRDSNNNVVYADMCNRSSDGTIYMTIPIGSGNTLLTQWFTSSSVTITTARFIPCQGNV